MRSLGSTKAETGQPIPALSASNAGTDEARAFQAGYLLCQGTR